MDIGGARIFYNWVLQGYSAVGHCEDTQWLSITRIFGDWAL